jgi:hypothetical protein
MRSIYDRIIGGVKGAHRALHQESRFSSDGAFIQGIDFEPWLRSLTLRSGLNFNKFLQELNKSCQDAIEGKGERLSMRAISDVVQAHQAFRAIEDLRVTGAVVVRLPRPFDAEIDAVLSELK